jgi:hypothetical protein
MHNPRRSEIRGRQGGCRRSPTALRLSLPSARLPRGPAPVLDFATFLTCSNVMSDHA